MDGLVVDWVVLVVLVVVVVTGVSPQFVVLSAAIAVPLEHCALPATYDMSNRWCFHCCCLAANRRLLNKRLVQWAMECSQLDLIKQIKK